MTFNISSVLAVGTGAFIGASVRFYVGIVVAKNFPDILPLATLTVNIAGSLFIGILIAIFVFYTPSQLLKLFLITGFLGALTTYSTFAIESYILLNSNFWYGILNITLNVVGSLISVTLGYKIVTYLLTK